MSSRQRALYGQQQYNAKMSSPPGNMPPTPPMSRVQTIDSQMQDQDTTSSRYSQSQSRLDPTSEQEDSNSGAVVPHRPTDPQSPEAEHAMPNYPQRRVQQYSQYPQYPQHPQNYQPTNAYPFTAPPLQHRGTASSNPYSNAPRTDSWNSFASSNASNQRRGHKYGNITIKGHGRAIQGNAYDENGPPAWAQDHEYGNIEIDGHGSTFGGDVPVSVLRDFWGGNRAGHGQQQREHHGYAPPPGR